MSFREFLATERQRVDGYLDACLPPASEDPRQLHEAVRYTVLAGGKRFRPILTIVFCGALGGDTDACLPVASAIELIHVSSLIHDDLPCMDDSDTRRGQPACHKVYGESTAVLVGDWLLVYPFEIVSRLVTEGKLEPQVCARVCEAMARAVCTQGIVAGQVLDLDAESHTVSAEELQRIHELKTAALIEACARVGAAVAKAPEDLSDAVAQCARALGLCFQVVDDVLDVEGDEAVLGKPTGADSENAKNTYVTLFGLEGAKGRAIVLADEARAALAPLQPSPWLDRAHELIDYVVNRSS